MSVQAHPDDQDFSIAGTLAKWSAAGCRIVSVMITSGDAGSNDPLATAADKPALALRREAEQTAANKILGVAKTVFLRFPDGMLTPSLELRRAITRIIRVEKPDVVVSGDPTAWFYGDSYVNHPDHRAAAEATISAVFPSAGTRLIFPELLDEGLEPHNVQRLYIHGQTQPNTWVDISSTIETKIAALISHESQKDTHGVEKRIREWAAEEGRPQGIAYAEGYRVMKFGGESDSPKE